MKTKKDNFTKSRNALILSFLLGGTVPDGLAWAYPSIDPTIADESECIAKAGDWDQRQGTCTIYISDGSDHEGDPSPSTSAVKISDGCYSLRPASGQTAAHPRSPESGFLCFEGLLQEGAIQQLKIVRTDANTKALECAISHQFAIRTSPRPSPDLIIVIDGSDFDLRVLQFFGTRDAGTLRFGGELLQYTWAPDQSSQRILSQCQ